MKWCQFSQSLDPSAIMKTLTLRCLIALSEIASLLKLANVLDIGIIGERDRSCISTIESAAVVGGGVPNADRGDTERYGTLDGRAQNIRALDGMAQEIRALDGRAQVI